MPAVLEDIEAEATGALSAAERYATRQVLRIESSVAVPGDSDVTTALDALDADADTSGRQTLRAELRQYKSGQILLDGGTDALTYDVALERWGVRNAIRLLLGFSAEPRPVTLSSDAIQLVSIPLTNYGEVEP